MKKKKETAKQRAMRKWLEYLDLDKPDVKVRKCLCGFADCNNRGY